MSSNFDSEVAIVGAGPTGLMLANLLGQAGVSVSVLEKRAVPWSIPRAVAFDPETLRLVQSVGLYEALKPGLLEDLPVVYLGGSGQLLAEVAECPRMFGHSPRGTFHQPELEAVLRRGLSRFPSVRVFTGTEVGDVADLGAQARLTLRCADGSIHRASADYVVAADGGSSRIRQRLGLRFTGDTFPEKWLVIDTRDDDLDDPVIRFYCDPRRPALSIPLARGRRRWEFLVMPGDDEVALAEAGSARAMMASYGATDTANIERCLVYTFHARMAESFGRGRIFLAGDAAHVMPPFAGQGLNSGMRDAANLAWKLRAVVRGVSEPRLLDSYEPERRAHVAAMTRFATRLGRVIMPTNRARAWLRDRVLRTAWRLGPLRRAITRGAPIPRPSLDTSTLVNWGAGAPVGEMLEQPTVGTSSGERPLDELLGPGWSVVGLGCDPHRTLHARDRELLAELGARAVSVHAQRTSPGAAVDSARALFTWARREHAVLIVRPDRFVVDCPNIERREPQLSWMRAAYALTTSTSTSNIRTTSWGAAHA